MTSRYCCTTLLGSGPRKTYTSRIPPVDLQLRAGLGCRTTSGGAALGLRDTCPPAPRGPGHLTDGWDKLPLEKGVLPQEPGNSPLRGQGTQRTRRGPWSRAGRCGGGLRTPVSGPCAPPRPPPEVRAGEATHWTHYRGKGGLTPSTAPLPSPHPVRQVLAHTLHLCSCAQGRPWPGHPNLAGRGGGARSPMALLFSRKTPWASPPSSSAR